LIVTTPKILLVDDVKLLLELEKSFLKNSSVRILTAANGEEALNMVRRERPDLVYMDLNMPKMDGKSCCVAIKADPELRTIPVIMVTTAGSPSEEESCREAGCDDYLTKPIDRRIFLEKGRCFVPDVDRREPRVACVTDVMINGGTPSGMASSADISVGGLYVGCDIIPELGKDLRISLNLPGTRTRISAKARIAWLNCGEERKKTRLPSGFGMEFTEIDTDCLKEIRYYIEAQRV
jgi:CheY-like chemotaxis protein/Tfp pilus assembly protein PilZ